MTRRGACVAFGSFEFVHKGHLNVAERVVELARVHSYRSIIISCPSEGEVYTTEKEKEYLLRNVGLEEFRTSSKDAKELLSELSGEFEEVILVLGKNHSELPKIQQFAAEYKMKLDIIEIVTYHGRPITSDWLQKIFDENDFEMLTKLCGHPYILIGDVVHGKKLGRTVGMPTINLHIYKTKKRPHCGVYATKVTLEDETYKSATNVGKRPTVDDFDYVTIETFILDFDKQIYGEICVLEVHKFLREVQKFDSLEAVQAQVQKDVSRVYELFEQA